MQDQNSKDNTKTKTVIIMTKTKTVKILSWEETVSRDFNPCHSVPLSTSAEVFSMMPLVCFLVQILGLHNFTNISINFF